MASFQCGSQRWAPLHHDHEPCSDDYCDCPCHDPAAFLAAMEPMR